MKILGAVLIFSACLFAGIQAIRPEKQRLDMLEGLCCALELMHAELSSRLSPMPVLCKFMAEHCEGAAGNFFDNLFTGMPELGIESFGDMWKQSAEKSFYALSKRELEEITRLGAVLGRYELSEQLKALEQCRIYLSECRDKVLRNYPNDRKLRITLAASAGVMLVAVLI